MTTSIGIDVGKNGCIAWIRDGKPCAVKMPETPADLMEVLMGIEKEGPCKAVLEFVRASPQMGVTSSFTFGRGYGCLETALTACGIPYKEVTPPVWMKSLSCMTKGDKSITKRKAQQLFPSMKVTNINADGLLIAEYCRLHFT
jgi:crossover junction endodeoxyribonuclease RuvC